MKMALRFVVTVATRFVVICLVLMIISSPVAIAYWNDPSGSVIIRRTIEIDTLIATAITVIMAIRIILKAVNAAEMPKPGSVVRFPCGTTQPKPHTQRRQAHTCAALIFFFTIKFLLFFMFCNHFTQITFAAQSSKIILAITTTAYHWNYMIDH